MKKLILILIMLLSFMLGMHRTYDAIASGGVVALSTTLLIVDSPRQRTAIITAANRSNMLQHYRVSVIDMVMNSNGSVSCIKDNTPPYEHSASSWIIATPSLVRLKPGETQTIRLLIRRPKTLKNGEYRAHLVVTQQPPADIAGGLKDESTKKGKLKFNVVTVYATSIPIIIKHGQINVSAKIKDAHLINNGKKITLKINRKGNASFRGFVMAQTGNTKPIYMPITIYQDIDVLDRTYELNALANIPGSIKLSLYKGIIPREGESPSGDILETLTVSR